MEGESGSGAGATEAAEWFYDDGAQPRGPFTLKAIGQMARAGVVRPDVPVARDGGAGWRPLSELMAAREPVGHPEKSAAPEFRVNLGGFGAPSSRMGFVWGAALRLGGDAALKVSGWKLLGIGWRLLGGFVSLIVLVPLAMMVIEVGVGSVAGMIEARVPVIPDSAQTPAGHHYASSTALRAAATHYVASVLHCWAAGLMVMSIFMIPLFVAKWCVVRRGDGRFRFPDGALVSVNKRTATMPLFDEGGRLIRAARITFAEEEEAARFMAAITGETGEGQPEEAS
ncbi:MAG TPA: DUF4339 domain-containing protein [Verrucomicrobiae bacterium]|nr:DUF4339 domain-containing protein [Verrucomicrobiae bacterium]